MYSLIRYVPDPIRGEFVNVGAIAGSDESSEWAVRQVGNPARARRLDERGSLPAVWSFIDRVGREIDAHEEEIDRPRLGETAMLSEDWLRDVTHRHKNIVQLSAPAPILAETAAEALEQIFDQLVVDPERHRGSENSKHPALAAVRRAYRERGLTGQDVHERVVIRAHDHRERIDFAVANGHVVQLAQTWSFRVADLGAVAERVRAWGWTVKSVQDRGGSIEVDGRLIDVPTDVDVAVVVVPPRDRVQTAEVEDAQAVFREVRARFLEVEHASEAADAAAERLHPALRA